MYNHHNNNPMTQYQAQQMVTALDNMNRRMEVKNTVAMPLFEGGNQDPVE